MTLSTEEMDGIFTDEDRKNKDTVVFQCKNCRKWTVHKNWISGEHNRYLPCEHCSKTDYDMRSIKSLRTYNPVTDNKRKIK